MNLTAKQKDKHYLMQGIELVEKIEASELQDIKTRLLGINRTAKRKQRYYLIQGIKLVEKVEVN